MRASAEADLDFANLGFAKKKAQLSYASPGRQRMLSAFAYNGFAPTLGARDAGLEALEASKLPLRTVQTSVHRNTLDSTA